MSELFQPALSLAVASSDGDRAASGQSPTRIDLAWRRCLTAWLSVENSAVMQQGKRRRRKKKKKTPVGSANDMIPDFPTLVAMEMCSICSVT